MYFLYRDDAKTSGIWSFWIFWWWFQCIWQPHCLPWVTFSFNIDMILWYITFNAKGLWVVLWILLWSGWRQLRTISPQDIQTSKNHKISKVYIKSLIKSRLKSFFEVSSQPTKISNCDVENNGQCCCFLWFINAFYLHL